MEGGQASVYTNRASRDQHESARWGTHRCDLKRMPTDGGCIVRCLEEIGANRIGELTEADRANLLRSWTPNARSGISNSRRFVQPTRVEVDSADLLYGDLNAFDPTASTKILQAVRFPVGLHHSESDGYFE
jgi:hypothetical protein